MIFRMEAPACICFDIEAETEEEARAKAVEVIRDAMDADDELGAVANGRAYFEYGMLVEEIAVGDVYEKAAD